MGNILIVEDDNNINNLLHIALKKAGYESTQAFSGSEAVLLLERESFSLILLDLMLPGISGEAVLEKVKSQSDTPVIVVTAKDSLDDRVHLLLDGADDYIIKPFKIDEVIARVVVQLRKHRPAKESEENKADGIISCGRIKLDKNQYKVFSSEKQIPKITKQEYAILELLCTNPNKIFEKNEIFSLAWGTDYYGETKTLDMHISNIRKKFKNLDEQDPVETIWGIGFKARG